MNRGIEIVKENESIKELGEKSLLNVSLELGIIPTVDSDFDWF